MARPNVRFILRFFFVENPNEKNAYIKCKYTYTYIYISGKKEYNVAKYKNLRIIPPGATYVTKFCFKLKRAGSCVF